ncbi:transketolase [Hespellia stercorisuis]|uniref:Transketolase subunit A n=1 Tax=Hespellia stercorisuis DSM 15480 TaxID=1121950 RepID=A0A1M6J6H6_9FIRM|nr:transketolase [Hespellia stercorisuis]SHJ42245.1 transketolase subunit A [Hespellia stercorisuis DSM 15480]
MSRNIQELKTTANTIRKDILEMIYNIQSGHLGGSFSEVEILTALYFDEMDYDPVNPGKPDRDRFVLSKGHTAPALYATLANAGFFPKEKLMSSFRRIDSMMQGHPDMKKTPGVEMTSGSLGIGLSTANGMALGLKRQNIDSRVYCMIGDGELNEGQIWEAAATASHYHLDNIAAFIDVNGLQNDAETKKVKDMLDIAAKWRAFGWNVIEINGHNFEEIFEALDTARAYKDGPTAIVAHTIKGKGVSFMENVVAFHGKTPTAMEYENGMNELNSK